jgi:thiol-disulfide isomerase/thioredoxin
MSGALVGLVFLCSTAAAPSAAASAAPAPLAATAPVPPARPAADAARLAVEAGAGRPAVLHFWATWCEACEDEFRRLGPLFNALPGRDVAVELVSIDAPETRARIAPMLERLGLARLPLAVLDAPDPAPVARALGEPKWDGTLPATFVFDARGKKVASFLGTTTRARLEKALRKARAAQ